MENARSMALGKACPAGQELAIEFGQSFVGASQKKHFIEVSLLASRQILLIIAKPAFSKGLDHLPLAAYVFE